MPKIYVADTELDVPPGTNLRKALVQAGHAPHNGAARQLNCHGLGTCGTCAVSIDGAVPPPGPRERARLHVPPHHVDAGLRLACRIRVEADIRVTKHPGFWGERIPKSE